MGKYTDIQFNNNAYVLLSLFIIIIGKYNRKKAFSDNFE